MRSLLVTLILGLAGGASFVLTASADMVQAIPPHVVQEMRSRAAKLRVSAGTDPETVWVGHVNTNTGLPGTPGGSGPYHIGRGANHIVGGGKLGTASDLNGVWDFDHFNPLEPDSLQGWWPVQCPFGSIGPTNFDDNLRPWFCLDYGNIGNYYPLQRGGATVPIVSSTTNGSTTVTSAGLFGPLSVGGSVSGTGIPVGAVVASIANTSSITISAAATATGSPTLTFTTPTNRTFGVLGYWHADGGNTQAAAPIAAGQNPLTPTWAPINGTGKSAWCGLRSAGDGAVMDPITGNPINSQVMDYEGVNSSAQFQPHRVAQGTDFNFPGYGSQWDQMMYRDINFPTGVGSGSLTISFKYTTNMDDRFDGNHASQAGWFDKDPIKTAAVGDGNFYSVNAAAVVDSFMVYVGAPVNDAAVTFSDGTVGTVFDPQRRWFSEVVKINTPGTTYKEILSTAAIQGSTAAPILFSTTVANNALASLLTNNNLRLVFRIKTNRAFDDETNGATGFSSGTAGAAIIDDVSVSGAGATSLTSGFETAGEIDNSLGTATTAAWKTTGKPPGAWFHVHNIFAPGANLPFEDPCGSPDAAVRFCNMYGNVLSPGNHDNQDKTGGDFGSNTQDQQKYIASPSINLVSVNGSNDVLNGSGVGVYNGMGIDEEIAKRVPQLWGDQLLNVYNYPITGNGFRYCWQSYPAAQANGVKTWGSPCKTGFFNFQTFPGCFESQIGVPKDDQLVHTSNASGVPDTVRVYIESMSRCFATALTALECSPSSGANAGGYYDDLSMAFISAPPPAALATNIWDLWNDAFPTNSTLKPVNAFGLAYDTLAANIRSAYNTAPQGTSTNITGPDAREDIPGDSMVVQSAGDNVRMDLVFRILPGVGNYVQIGNRASGIARRPDTVPRTAALTTDPGNGALTAVDKFWGTYMADNGAFGTGGNGVTGPGHTGGVWDPNRWNSARCDTLEVNFFPIDGLFDNNATAKLTPGSYMSTYHEADPKYSILGIAKNRCFFNRIKKPVKISAVEMNCGNLGGGNPYPPTFFYPGQPSSGFPQSGPEIPGGAIGQTWEFTKIIPDGQLTPGALIQYFFRKSNTGSPTVFDMAPDTNFIFPQNAEGGYFDYHRWRTTAVLPDRWKDQSFGGNGMACMLVLDFASRRGDVGTFIAMADSIGLTTPGKRGAHNGWHARPDQNFIGVNVGGDDTICRRDNGGQAGSLFDLYSVIAGESNVPAGRAGSRAASHDTQGGSLTLGKWSTNGPSADMANNYRVMIGLASDSGPELLGPIANQTDDDIGLFTNFMVLSGGSAQPRAFMLSGEQLGEGFANDHPTFPPTFLRSALRTGDYRSISGNGNNTADLIVQPPVSGASPATYGVFSQCFLNNDVFTVQVAAPSGQAGAYYENVGSQGPYVAAVYAPDVSGTRPFRTLYLGWTVGLFGGMGTRLVNNSTPPFGLLTIGTQQFYFNALTTAFGGLVCQPQGGPTGVGDNNGSGPGSVFVNFLNLKSSNPMHSGQARIAFGVEKTEKVQVRIYDVTGRVVKTVADRVFAGGQEHVLTWDGTNDNGDRVKSGVYFYQLKSPTWTSQKKLAVLAN